MAAEPIRDNLSELVSAAVQVNATGSLDRYLRWNLLNLLDELNEDDFTTQELMAINVLLAQAFSRKLSLTHPGIRLSRPRVGGAVPQSVTKTRLRMVPT